MANRFIRISLLYINMKILHTEITPLTNEFLHIDLRNQLFLSSPFHTHPSFHSHPELELVFIAEGFGKRIIGNKIESFEAGDMVFVGSNLPHVWLSDASFYEEGSNLRSTVIVTYFNPEMFQLFFDTVKEFKEIKEMIRQAAQGLRITGKTRTLIAKKLILLANKTGFEKIHGFMQIMHLISITEEKSFIINTEEQVMGEYENDRLIEVIKFVKANLGENINLKQVAEIACMTEQSFCRFFKTRLQKNFSQYLAELRMVYASSLLLKAVDKTISEIACNCGYGSSSHFCKVFKDHYGQSPFQYKNNIPKMAK